MASEMPLSKCIEKFCFRKLIYTCAKYVYLEWRCVYAHTDISFLYLSKQINLFAPNPIVISEKDRLYQPHMQGQICLLNHFRTTTYTIGYKSNCSASAFIGNPPLPSWTLTEKLKCRKNKKKETNAMSVIIQTQ